MTDHPHATLTRTFEIHVYQTGPDGHIRPSVIADPLQVLATEHADLLGCGLDDMTRLGLAWVLSRLCLVLERTPKPGETIAATTWSIGVDRHAGYRQFELLDDTGALLGRAASTWAVIDLATRKMAPIPELSDILIKGREQVLDYTGRTVPKLREPAYVAPLMTRRADLDINGHVNNARLMDWILEPLPMALSGAPDAAPAGPPLTLDIAFRAECLPGDLLRAGCAPHPDENGQPGFLHNLVRLDESGAPDTEVVRARTAW